MSNIPRIYVACLASYNNSKLHGKWIDCNVDLDDIQREIQEMLDTSPEPNAEGWAIHDYENWNGLKLNEHEDIDDISQAAQLIDKYGKLFCELISYVGGIKHLEEATFIIEQNYQGEFKSLTDWAEKYLYETGTLSGLPNCLKCYFNYEDYARDCELNGDIFTIEINNSVHVFCNN